MGQGREGERGVTEWRQIHSPEAFQKAQGNGQVAASLQLWLVQSLTHNSQTNGR